MKPSKREYIIPFVGLKLGKHEFTFQVKDTFFEQLDYSPISNGKLDVTLVLNKKETMLIADFSVEGVVTTACDRCDTPVELPIHGALEIIYKFGNEDSGDENLIVLFPEDYEIDVQDPIYQMIILALPTRKIHAPGECDEEMWKLIQKYTVNTEYQEEEELDDDKEEDNLGFEDFNPNDPRWSLVNNKN